METNHNPEEDIKAQERLEKQKLMDKQNRDRFSAKMAKNLTKLFISFVIFPFVIMTVNYLLFVLPFDYADISYWQALVIGLVISLLHKLLSYND